MARGGLYKSDIAKARRAVLAEGKHPSVDAIRVALGNTGSKTTIHRHLKEIEAEEGQGPGAKVAVSDALQDLVSRLAARLREEAEAIVADAKSQTDATLQTSASLLALRTKESTELRDQLQRTELALQTESTGHAEARDALTAARLAIAQLEERVAGLTGRLTEQEAHAASLEEKHRHARDALEHFRTATKEQRDQDQRRHEHEVQTLQIELRQAGDAVREKTQDLMQLNRDNARLTEQLGQAQQATQTIERERQQHVAELRALRPLPAQLTALQSQAASAMAQAEGLKQELSAANGQAQVARDALRVAELEIARTAAKLEALEGVMAQHAMGDRGKRRGAQSVRSGTLELPEVAADSRAPDQARTADR